MNMARIAIGCDHGGLELKQGLIGHLESSGRTVIDCGIRDKRTADYPRIAHSVALRVAAGDADAGIIIDGAGIGSAMAANKVRGIRAAACYNDALANNCREHNDANILTLGAGQTTLDQARSIVSIFLSTACTVDRHRRRVRLIEDIEKGSLRHPSPSRDPHSANQESAVELTPEDIEKIAHRVKELLVAGQQGAGVEAASPPLIAAKQMAQMIDHTLLKPEASQGDVERLCKEAIEHSFFSVCVNPANVTQATGLVQGSGVKVCCVVGFPLGAQAPEIKALEARKAIREGSKEIDMVINVGALKSHDDNLVLRDIRGVVEACKERSVLCKVILETSLLNDDEKVRACELSMKAGADYVKTSTGFGSAGAKEEDIRLMSRTVAPKKLGVKASGGVRTYEDAIKMAAAGATRIGASSSVKIIEEAKARAG